MATKSGNVDKGA